MKVGVNCTPEIKITFKWITDLNAKYKPVKPLEKLMKRFLGPRARAVPSFRLLLIMLRIFAFRLGVDMSFHRSGMNVPEAAAGLTSSACSVL